MNSAAEARSPVDRRILPPRIARPSRTNSTAGSRRRKNGVWAIRRQERITWPSGLAGDNPIRIEVDLEIRTFSGCHRLHYPIGEVRRLHILPEFPETIRWVPRP